MIVTGLPYLETFDGNDGDPWPAPWTISNPSVLIADIDGGRARLSGETATTSRMVNTEIDALDFDAVFTVRFETYLAQGAGFYVRQNGGTLDDTIPHGQGYAVFVEGGYLGLIGLWHEIDGVEENIAATPAPIAIVDGVDYRIRFQCEQDAGFTWLRTRMWAAGDPEPMGWDLETTDASAELQGTRGGLGADVYEYENTPLLWFDDIAVTGS